MLFDSDGFERAGNGEMVIPKQVIFLVSKN
jgi:hypothetical protein